MRAILSPDIIKQLRRKVDFEEYRAIRQLWIDHSVAEGSRNFPGLMATLTDDRVYTVVNRPVSWHGKEGATRFYQHLLPSFPDIHFDQQHIIIGPQNAYEEAHVAGTYEGKRTEFDVVIVFSWDTNRHFFSGERIHVFNSEFTRKPV